MKKLTYSMFIIMSVFIAFWLFLPNKQSKENTPITNHESLATSDTYVDTHTINTIKVDTTSNVVKLHCDTNCQEGIEQLRFQAQLNDDEYETLLNQANQLANYLKQNPNAIDEFIELATTSSPNHRSVIISAFNSLDTNIRSSLGKALITSPNWHSRFDGINVLAQPDIMNQQVAQQFSTIIHNEPDYYVRSNMVKAFNQPDKFYGDRDIISTLEELTYSDIDNTVRGEALLTRIQLEQNPENVFSDAFSAIRSNEADYQGYGLRALEQILTKKSLDESDISWEYQEEVKALFEELKGPEYYNMPANLRQRSDNLLIRFFE